MVIASHTWTLIFYIYYITAVNSIRVRQSYYNNNNNNMYIGVFNVCSVLIFRPNTLHRRPDSDIIPLDVSSC